MKSTYVLEKRNNDLEIEFIFLKSTAMPITKVFDKGT